MDNGNQSAEISQRPADDHSVPDNYWSSKETPNPDEEHQPGDWADAVDETYKYALSVWKTLSQ